MLARMASARGRARTRTRARSPLAWRVVLTNGIRDAEALLGKRVSGVGPDIISRASAIMHEAVRASRAADEAVAAPARQAGKALADAVIEAWRLDKDAMRAAGEGASELVSDAWRLVVGPVVVLGLLYLLTKG